MPFDPTPSEYEEGVAEILVEKSDGRGAVERNAKLPSRSGVRDRQIDVLVRLHLPDMDDELIVVDCKKYGAMVDVNDVDYLPDELKGRVYYEPSGTGEET